MQALGPGAATLIDTFAGHDEHHCHCPLAEHRCSCPVCNPDQRRDEAGDEALRQGSCGEPRVLPQLATLRAHPLPGPTSTPLPTQTVSLASLPAPRPLTGQRLAPPEPPPPRRLPIA